MKKHLLFLSSLIVISLAALAQSTIQLENLSSMVMNNQTIDHWEDTGTFVMNYEFHAKNIGTTTKSYMMKRQEIFIVPGTDNYICWDACHAPMVNQSLISVPIAAGGTYTLSSCHYRPFGNLGTSTIRYVIWDSLNVNDSAWFVINWHGGTLGVENQNSVTGTISAYPNPANASTSIKYELTGSVNKASVKIYNMLGSVIKEVKLTNVTGTVNVSTAELEQGVYFYAVFANDRVVATRKLVITH